MQWKQPDDPNIIPHLISFARYRGTGCVAAMEKPMTIDERQAAIDAADEAISTALKAMYQQRNDALHMPAHPTDEITKEQS